jgi:hypothetical protein
LKFSYTTIVSVHSYVTSSHHSQLLLAIFLNGYQVSNNVAVLSDGSTVDIDNVNCGRDNDGINTKNCDLYVDNNVPNSKFYTEMDGFTVPLQSRAQNLMKGDNVITFAIADVGDSQFDSWVLIQSSALKCTPVMEV